MFVAACAVATTGCSKLADKIAELKAEATASTPSASPSASIAASAAPSDTTQPATSASAPASAEPAEAPSAAASSSSEPTAESQVKPNDIIPACSKEVGVDRARVLWRDCLAASADRAPESLQGKLCFTNQSQSCSKLHRGIQGGCLTGSAPAFCSEYLNRLIDVNCNIKTIDWRNHRYPQGFFKIAGEDDEHFWEIKNGTGKSQAHVVSLGKIFHADLDSDSSTEALVTADVQPNEPRAAVTSSMVAVFEGDPECSIRRLDSIAIVHGATTSVLTPPVFSVESNRLVGVWEEFDPKKSEDLLKIRTEWTLQNNKLKEARKKVNRIAGGNASAGDKPADETAKDEGAPKDNAGTAKVEDAGKNDAGDAKNKGIRAKRKRKKVEKD